MALLFTASSTDNVDCGSDASLDNLDTGTYLSWVYVTSTATPGRIISKGDHPGGQTWLMVHTAAIDCGVQRPGYLEANATFANVSTFGTDKWSFLGFQHDTGGVDSDQKIFHGDLQTLAIEVTTYAAQNVGSGARGSNATDNQYIGNWEGLGNPLIGRIGFASIWNRQLSLGEIQAQQFRPHVTSGCVLFMYPGYTGTGTQPDWSGNGNNGTVTGATVADHVPLPSPFGFDLPWHQAAAAAGGTHPVGPLGHPLHGPFAGPVGP